MTDKIRMGDVYEEAKNWRETHGHNDRPEYVLKNGRARKCYGLLKDVHALQDRITQLESEREEAIEELESCLSILTTVFMCSDTDDLEEDLNRIDSLISKLKGE